MKQRHDGKQEMKDMRSFPRHKSFGILTFYMQTDMTGENKQHTLKFTNRCYRNSFLYSVTSFSTDFKRLAYTHSKTQDSSFNWLSLYYAICEYIEAQIATLGKSCKQNWLKNTSSIFLYPLLSERTEREMLCEEELETLLTSPAL